MMKEILFASDLDNTLLYSYRRKQETDRCVERLEGREQGFFTRRTLELLPQVCENAWFVPVTTRSVAQYRRIVWPPACAPRYAVTTNGGILLVDGQVDAEWHAQTRTQIAPWRGELAEVQGRLPDVPIPKRSRMVDDIYLFAACDNAEDAEAVGRFFEGDTSLEIAVSGRKAYFFPPPVNKGAALARLKAKLLPRKTICAGDSVIDVPMLCAADLAIVPDEGMLPPDRTCFLRVPGGSARFSDFVLESVRKEIAHLSDG